ncbi:kinase-like domain-containing protein [Lineolata rhizophorae]|uniref:Kinase-like domain-containing protein n=1 Tax=Lineolata rhizophorae TaxID=578093 RepID=A0A6A6P2Z6_9PEZI|nr:kinase-like domain-containing protein [Lineolata rhizophorae]
MAGPVRQPIDVAALERYVEANVPDVKVPIAVKQFGFGQSNPTYQLTDRAGAKFVMRKKPPGKLLSKTAHKVEREYRVIHALAGTDVPVPRAYCLCMDDAVVGSPFYIMEFLDGRIFEDMTMPGVSAADREEMYLMVSGGLAGPGPGGEETRFHDAARTLGKLHALDQAAVGLADYGKPAGFYARQLALFASLSRAQAAAVDVDTGRPVGPIPRQAEMLGFFAGEAAPPGPRDRAALVHGDFKIDNLVYHKTEPRIIGILDWEMSTIGHPLSDLCNLLAPWTVVSLALPTAAAARSPARPPLPRSANLAFHPATARAGVPPRPAMLRWYAAAAGWAPSPADLAWGAAFSLLRDCVIVQGIAARYAARQASSERAREYAAQLGPVAGICWRAVERAREEGRKGEGEGEGEGEGKARL